MVVRAAPVSEVGQGNGVVTAARPHTADLKLRSLGGRTSGVVSVCVCVVGGGGGGCWWSLS